MANVVGKSVLCEKKWLRLMQLSYKDANGALRTWESVERTTRGSSDCDAVAVVPRLFGRNEVEKTILVRQFRPPLDSYTLENVAGLVDDGETPEQAACRELKEETGYTACRVTKTTPPIFSDPGISNTNFRFVFVDVDLDQPENKNVKQDLDEGEHIQVFVVPMADLIGSINRLSKETNSVVDAKCFALALGMSSKL